MGHFEQLETSITETDKMVLAATKLIQNAWNNGLACSFNPFDETIERKWVKNGFFMLTPCAILHRWVGLIMQPLNMDGGI
jgi:hypothetical protein